jgi:hypothetical protein
VDSKHKSHNKQPFMLQIQTKTQTNHSKLTVTAFPSTPNKTKIEIKANKNIPVGKIN